MFTSDTEMKRRGRRLLIKSMTAYFSVSILCLVITNVYALFGHGVRSESMDFMFLYPLIGGTGVFLLMTLIAVYLPERLREVSRVGYNLHNSGIASLTSAAMLTGIMEIAGTSSKWIGYIKLAGYVLVCGAFVCQSLRFLKRAVR